MIFLPSLIQMIVALWLDFTNRKMVHRAVEDIVIAENQSEKERRKLDKIPRRAIMINSVLTIVMFSFQLGQFIEEPEDKMMVRRLFGFVICAFRNLIIAKLAFQVNQQIKKETVNDRRLLEIQEAIQRREERRARLREAEEIQEQNNVPTYMRELQDLSVIGTKYAGQTVKSVADLPDVSIV